MQKLSPKLLQGKLILDLSHRLPGPLAGHILAGMGAEVIKIEDEVFQDPFLEGLFKQMDQSFITWYQKLNHRKQIKRMDFKSEKAIEDIRQLVLKADGIIMGLPPKVRTKLKLDQAELETHGKPMAVIEMGSYNPDLHPELTTPKGMHDLNALAKAGLLSLYVKDSVQMLSPSKQQTSFLPPPFLPMAGIAFGQNIAMELVAAMLKAYETQKIINSTVFLLDATIETFGPFWGRDWEQMGQSKFLHNGLFPCYGIYPVKDGHIALAAVEEKYWLGFCKLFKLTFTPNDRFLTENDSIFQALTNLFLKYTKQEIATLTETEDICLDII